MRCIAPVLTLIALCVPVTSAHAWSPPPRDDSARLDAFLPIARAAWPGSPCAGREVVHVRADAALRAQAPLVTGNPHQELDGMAAPELCTVWMSGGLSALTFCSVLVHEFGHLAGHEHTDAPGDVMNGHGDVDHAPCQRAVTPPPSARVAEELRTVLPAPRAAWRITCGPRRGTERRCLARRGSALRRYFVSTTRNTITVAAA